MSGPSVSVVLAVHDTRPFVRQAVLSALGQDYPALEVVAVDDGSTDGSLDELRAFEGEPRFRLIAEPHRGLGPPGTRNTGVRCSTGDYLLFLDGDDFLRPGLVARLAALVDPGDPMAYAYCDYIKVDLAGQPVAVNDYSVPRVRHRLEGSLLAPLLLGNYVQPNGVLFSRRLFDELGGMDTRYPGCDDYDLWLRAACAGATARFCPEALACYRQRPGSLITHREAQEAMTAAIREAAVRDYPGAVAAAVPDLVVEAQTIAARLWHEGREALDRAAAYAAELDAARQDVDGAVGRILAAKDAALDEAASYAAGLEAAREISEETVRRAQADRDVAAQYARSLEAALAEKEIMRQEAERYAFSLVAALEEARSPKKSGSPD